MKRAATGAALVALGLASASCRDCAGGADERAVDAGAGDAGAGRGAGASAPFVDAAPSVDASSVLDASAVVGSASGALTSRPFDGGAASCTRIYGPARQPFDGPAALVVRGDRLELVTNDRGKPQVTAVAIPASLTAVVPPMPNPPGPVRDTVHPRCAVAGDTVYCVGSGSILSRFPRAGSPTEVATVVSVRGISAASLGPDHDVVAFHQQRRTSEGFVSEGWVSLDGSPPEKLSEEGSGATAIELAAAPGSAPSSKAAHADVIALSLDARVAMTPMHARHLTLDDARAHLQLGSDEVVFIGPLAEPGTVPRLGTSARGAFALVAWPREARDFGLSVVALPDPLRIDLPAVWSLYKNGLDPAPLAATHDEGRDAPVAVVRVVPATVDPHGELVLELGTLASDGTFLPASEIARGRTLADVSITRDQKGALWILWSDAEGTWLERRVCP